MEVESPPPDLLLIFIKLLNLFRRRMIFIFILSVYFCCQIKISHQMAWRRSDSSSSYCDDAKISSQAMVTVSASTYCRAGCNSTSSVSSLYGRCIAFSASEDWTLTEGSFLFKAPTPGIAYTLRFETNRPNGGDINTFSRTCINVFVKEERALSCVNILV